MHTRQLNPDTHSIPLFVSGNHKSNTSTLKTKRMPNLPSLRRDKQVTHQKDITRLDVTPEFQAYVGKKLGEVIDNTYDCVQIQSNDAKLSPCAKFPSNDKELSTENILQRSEGIKLFSESKTNLVIEHSVGLETQRNQKRPDLLAHIKKVSVRS